MSGHTEFTRWISRNAKYILVNGIREDIEDTFFTSGEMHNSNNFNIKTNKGCYELSDSVIDFTDLRNRCK